MQARAIRNDPDFRGGDYYGGPLPSRGLGLARFIGFFSYRSELELQMRFGRQGQEGEDPYEDGRYAVESYLDYQAEKLIRRFDANTYLVLSRAMDHHDVGRGRGGTEAALGRVTATSAVVGVDSDRLYPTHLQYELSRSLPDHPDVKMVQSPYGHDAFLIEIGQVGKAIAEALASPV
jgi:homoserine O-acetyltransferase